METYLNNSDWEPFDTGLIQPATRQEDKKMGFFSDTVGTSGKATPTTTPKKKAKPVDPDGSITLKGEAATTTGDSAGLSETTRKVISELFGASAAARAFVCELADGYKKAGVVDNDFRRCFVHKDAPEGDYFLDEDKALDKWEDEYISVYRLVTGKKLGRVATPEEAKKLIRLDAERKRKAREKADKDA